MITKMTAPALFSAVALSLAAAVPLAKAVAAQDTPQIYGSQLMTKQERLEHRQRLLDAETSEERERIRAEHHERMKVRAKEMGVALPDKPPAQGMRQGRGGGAGSGQGGGRRKSN